MSDLVKSSGQKITKRRTQKVKAAEQIDVETKTETDLSEVAIAAADAPFAKAIEVFNDRYAQNLQMFGAHVRGVQQSTSQALKAKILNAHGVNEGEMYDD